MVYISLTIINFIQNSWVQELSNCTGEQLQKFDDAPKYNDILQKYIIEKENRGFFQNRQKNLY